MPPIHRRECPVCCSMYREPLEIVHKSNIHPDGPIDWCLLRCECSHEYIDPVPDDRILGWLGTSHLEAEALAAVGSGCVALDDVLGKLRDPKSALKAIRDGVADGGLVVVVEPRRRAPRARLREWLRVMRMDRGEYIHHRRFTQMPSVLHHFTRESLLDLVSRTGLEPVSVRRGRRLEIVAKPRALFAPRRPVGRQTLVGR